MPIPSLSPRALLVVALAAAALGFLAAPAAALGKTPKCKTGQMLVKVGKKAVCKRTTTLFPNPKAADARVEFVKFALAPATSKPPGKRGCSSSSPPAPATSKPPGKRGKRVRTFASFKAAKKVRKSILRLLPKVLAKVDAAQPVKAASLAARGSADPVARAAGCTAPEKPSTYTSKDGNSTMSASVSAEGTEIGFDGTTSGGITIHFTYLTDAGCDPLKVPACPQASGEVTAQGTKFDNVLMDIKQNGKVLSHTNVKGKRATKATGQNAADAKLDRVRIEDVLSSSVTVQGPGFPRTTISGSFTRTAVWD